MYEQLIDEVLNDLRTWAAKLDARECQLLSGPAFIGVLAHRYAPGLLDHESFTIVEGDGDLAMLSLAKRGAVPVLSTSMFEEADERPRCSDFNGREVEMRTWLYKWLTRNSNIAKAQAEFMLIRRFLEDLSSHR